jgi:hypothetical protein
MEERLLEELRGLGKLQPQPRPSAAASIFSSAKTALRAKTAKKIIFIIIVIQKRGRRVTVS